MLRPTVQLLGEIAAIYAGVHLLGWWPNGLLRRLRPDVDRPLTVVLGLAILCIVGWFASSVLDVGLDRLWPWYFTSSVVAGFGLFTLTARRDLLAAVRPTHPRMLIADVTAAVSSVLLTVIGSDELLARGTLSISSPNNDVAAYIALANGLSEHGFSNPGTIAGLDVGHVGRTDVYGAYAYLSFGRWLVERYGFQIALAAIAVVALVIAQALGRLLVRWTSLPPFAIGLLAVVPQSTFLFTYVSTMYFLSQLLGLMFAIVMLEVVTRDDRSWRSPGSICIVALLSAGLVMVYPHMAFLFPPVAAAVVLGVAGRRWRTAMARIAVFAGGVLVGLVVVLPRTREAIDRLVALNRVVAGWPLDGILPWGLIGQQDSFTGTVSALTIVGSAVILGASVAASVRLVRRYDQRWPIAACWATATCLVTYAGFYFLRGGPAYEQWKWISFLQPIFVVALLAPVLDVVIREVPPAWHRIAPSALAVTALLALVVASMNKAVPYSSAVNQSRNWVPVELGTLGSSPAFAGIDAVNIDLGPYWESMWAADAVAPRHAFVLNTTYYTPSQPDAAWTLVHVPVGGVPDTAQEMRSVGTDLLLVHRPEGQTSASLAGMGAEIDARLAAATIPARTVGRVTVEVRNTGSVAWLGSGGTAGSVNIGGSLVDDAGHVLQLDLVRAGVVPFPFALLPGESRSVTFDLPQLPPGRHRLRIDVVDEMVGWLGDAGLSTPVVLELTVSP